jgi:6-phosphogluconate dehydrogenase
MSSPIQPGADLHFGLTGLAVMGQNLSRNIAGHGFPIAVHNRTTAKTDSFIAEHGREGQFVAAAEAKEFVAALARPRAIMIMVKAGPPVDDVIEELLPFLEPGDLIIDGGNSDWTDTARRLAALAAREVLYLGTGVSGGEEGALHGPSLMPGGSRAAYELVEPVFTRIAAQVDGTPCCTYIGDGGAGHYVKTVHNGIEYADMQLIAESYDLLHSGLGLDNDALHDVFTEWNAGDLDSFLIQITAEVFARRDDDGDGYLVDKVLDRAGQKGTGRHTAQSALELGAPVTAITEAVFARSLSALKDERVAASKLLPDPGDTGPSQLVVDDVRDALYASKIVAYAQGFDQLQRASDEFGWSLDLGALATIWRGGCIIRARFLDRIKEVYESGQVERNLTLAPYFTDALRRALLGWRRTVAEAIRTGVPTPAYSSALAWYDGYRRARLPANLIQAQRDLFGAHTYERVDRDGTFHSDWQQPPV